MPRPNPPRSLQGEAGLAQRIGYERTRRGWTYDGLAKRLTNAGCPIQASAVFKIEKGSPRRRITVDELVAFSRVFEVDAEELLLPPGMVATQELISLWDAYLEAGQLQREADDACRRTHKALRDHLLANPDVRGALRRLLSDKYPAADEPTLCRVESVMSGVQRQGPTRPDRDWSETGHRRRPSRETSTG